MNNGLYFFFLFVIQFSFCQNILKGEIKDEKGNPIENVNVTIEDVSDESIIAFSITDSNGFYQVKIDANLSNLQIRVSNVYFKEQVIYFNNKSQNIDFVLKEAVNVLEEVKVEIKPIEQKKDTINFNVKNFEGKGDRSLADVLKRMPGIEVEESGKIKYQGVPINKFYVEGKDLMSGGYSVLTNALPSEAVTKVQVLEEHQPIKILSDKVPSNRAAINIRLKKNTTLAGNAELSTGLPLYLWDTKITPIIFKKKFQSLYNLKSNNIGRNENFEIQTFSFDEGFEGLTYDNLTGKWLNISQLQNPKINENRYLFNESFLISTDFLTNLKDDLSFKVNMSLSKSKNYKQGNSFTSIINQNGQPINFYRSTSINELENTFKIKASIDKNSKKKYYKNTLTLKTNYRLEESNMQINSNSVNQNLNSPSISLQNSYSSLFFIKQNVANIKSVFNFVSDKQSYFVNPYSNIAFSSINQPYNELFQNVESKEVNLLNEISFIIPVNKIYATETIGLSYDWSNLKSNLFGLLSDFENVGNAFNNHVNFFKVVPSFSTKLTYSSDSWNLNSNFPIMFNFLKAIDNFEFKKDLKKLTFEPNIEVKYKFNSEFSNLIYSSVKYNFGSQTTLYPNFIFSDLSLKNNNNEINQQKVYLFGGNLEMKKVLNELFLNINYELSKSNTNLLISNDINSNGQVISMPVSIENHNFRKSVSTEISKYFTKFRSKISLKATFFSEKGNSLINNVEQVYDINGQSLSLTYLMDYFAWLTIDENLILGQDKRTELTSSKVLRNNFRALFFINETNSIQLTREDYFNKFQNQKLKNYFIDLMYQYTLKKKKIDVFIKWENIMNKNSYNETIINSLGYSLNNFLIRPSQLMFSIKFYFN